MRNLDICNVTLQKLNFSSEEEVCICQGYNENTESNCFIICTHNLVLHNFSEKGEITWTKDITAFVSANNKPVKITHLSLPNACSAGFSNGELITISDSGNTLDLAGVCDNGLLAMEWSPDQELLVLVTRDLKTILMTCTYDPINEIYLLDSDFGEKQFITVGWGKKETQFHGSVGKQAAKEKVEVRADSNSLSPPDTVRITWRGDGNYYAIGFTMEGIRRFKVFDREGHLQYTSEKQPSLETNLSWRPSGNLIATTQKLTDKYIVIFFEKNGLKHGEFEIPVNSTTCVEDIIWSSDSEILTIQCRDMSSGIQKLLLFTTSNYHWYLKQTLTFNNQQRICKAAWSNDFDVANNKKMHVILQNGLCYCYSWIWNIDHSSGKDDNDNAILTVIDGQKLKITGFRQTVVPPPMASLEIDLGSYINSVHFISPSQCDMDTNTFFVCTADHKLVFYTLQQKFPLHYSQFKTITFNEYDFPFQCYNWLWLKFDTILCTMIDNNGDYNVKEYNIDGDKIVNETMNILPGAPLRIEPHPNNNSVVFIQLSNGEIVEYKLGGDIDPQNSTFGAPCIKFNVVSIEGNLNFIGISLKGSLFVNDVIIMSNVSSFFVHTHFLLVTTLQHILLCTELTVAGINAIKEYQKSESKYVYKRKIERGAKLVIAVANDTRTVFQLPRGNLETIQPRPLSLKIIGEYLNSLKYYEAFDLMRKQRINLNLIYDHDPEKFIKHIDLFLECITNNSWLSLFLSDLENSNVTETMYSSSYAGRINNLNETDTKIDKICDLIREQLKKRSDTDNKILPLLTTFVKKNTVPDLEMALTIVKQLKTQESEGSKLPVGSDEALKYLLYIVDVNRLFDVALGMYDFDLVLLVANKSQKDPKEYIPMLNELNQMDGNYQRFVINKHLKRFDKAVQCLVKCGPSRYNELKTFVKYHSLYRESLSLFSPNDEIYRDISEDFGLYLRLKKQYIEAGVIYERAHNMEKAVDCFKDALEWQLAVKIAHAWPKEEFQALCRSLVENLKEEKRHKEALIIMEQYLNNQEETIIFAIDSGQYKSALRLYSVYNKSHLKDDHLLPAVLEEFKKLKELIETNWNTFLRHRERLQIVRDMKSRIPEENYDASYNNKDSDLYSDAGSTLASSSRGSSRSYRSSKNRRKHERKVASLKEGSQYEDVALVMALHSLVTSTFELREQVKEVNIVLSCLDKEKEALILQRTLEKLLKEMKDSFKDIWTSELVLEATKAYIAAQDVPDGCSVIPQGIASLDPHVRIAPVIQDVNWKLDGLNYKCY